MHTYVQTLIWLTLYWRTTIYRDQCSTAKTTSSCSTHIYTIFSSRKNIFFSHQQQQQLHNKRTKHNSNSKKKKDIFFNNIYSLNINVYRYRIIFFLFFFLKKLHTSHMRKLSKWKTNTHTYTGVRFYMFCVSRRTRKRKLKCDTCIWWLRGKFFIIFIYYYCYNSTRIFPCFFRICAVSIFLFLFFV